MQHENKNYTGHALNVTPKAERNPLFAFIGQTVNPSGSNLPSEGFDCQFRIVRMPGKPTPEDFARYIAEAGGALRDCSVTLYPDEYRVGIIRYRLPNGTTGEAQASDVKQIAHELAQNYERLSKEDAETLRRIRNNLSSPGQAAPAASVPAKRPPDIAEAQPTKKASYPLPDI